MYTENEFYLSELNLNGGQVGPYLFKMFLQSVLEVRNYGRVYRRLLLSLISIYSYPNTLLMIDRRMYRRILCTLDTKLYYK